VSPEALALRRQIFASFAATGEPPRATAGPELDELVDGHVVVLDSDGHIRMAHPFAGHQDGARLDAGGRSWWGNCAWDALGIAAALELRQATVTSNGIIIAINDGQLAGEAIFHVAVPARRWWQDIADT
jgi:Alkylmercury lyase